MELLAWEEWAGGCIGVDASASDVDVVRDECRDMDCYDVVFKIREAEDVHSFISHR